MYRKAITAMQYLNVLQVQFQFQLQFQFNPSIGNLVTMELHCRIIVQPMQQNQPYLVYTYLLCQ